MPTSVEAKKASVQTNQNGVELMIINRNRVLTENNDLTKTDTERGNTSNPEKSGPKRGTSTRVPNIISLMTTSECTCLVFALKSRLSAPMIRNSTDMGESESEGYAGRKQVRSNYPI